MDSNGHLVLRFEEKDAAQIAAVVQDQAEDAFIESFESYGNERSSKKDVSGFNHLKITRSIPGTRNGHTVGRPSYQEERRGEDDDADLSVGAINILNFKTK